MQVVQTSPKEVLVETFDLGVYVAGYEARSTWFVQSKWCPALPVSQWRHVEFSEERGTHSASMNLRNPLGGILGGIPAPRDWDGHWRKAWRETLEGEFYRLQRPIKVLVDISSMPRAVYGALLLECALSKLSPVASVTLAYVPGKHVGEMTAHRQLDGLRPLVGLEGRFEHGRDTVLLLGLGFDGALAEAVVDLFQLDAYGVFYADPGTSRKNVARCTEANRHVISGADLAKVAPVNDIAQSLGMILSIAQWYLYHRDVIVVPIGPKTHIVAAILASIVEPRLGFRCLRTSLVRPVQVNVVRGTVPVFTRIHFPLL